MNNIIKKFPFCKPLNLGEAYLSFKASPTSATPNFALQLPFPVSVQKKSLIFQNRELWFQ